jgi:heme/copper-type cytochrome/quinol oxidase subunit 2
MNNYQANTELIFTLFMMAVLLVLGIVAVVFFFRVWRKEKKEGGRKFFE